MAAELTRDAHDQLRADIQRERRLAEQVRAAEKRLSDAIADRDAAVAAHDRVLARCRHAVAEALSDYVNEAGVDVGRAAIILGRTQSELIRMVDQT